MDDIERQKQLEESKRHLDFAVNLHQELLAKKKALSASGTGQHLRVDEAMSEVQNEILRIEAQRKLRGERERFPPGKFSRIG